LIDWSELKGENLLGPSSMLFWGLSLKLKPRNLTREEEEMLWNYGSECLKKEFFFSQKNAEGKALDS